MEFNSLPLDVHLEIFSYLSVREVMSIRRVCKQWNCLINEVRFKRLSCYQLRYGQVPSWHDFSFRSIRSFLDYANADAKFNQLKYLNASLCPNYAQLEDAFDFLNSFRSLEDVRFSCFMGYPWEINREEIEKKTLVLNLDRLKKADIYLAWQLNNLREATWEHSKVSVLLDLPSLLELTVNSWKGFTLKYPEKLKTLANFGLFKQDQDYSKFTSLSSIYTIESDLRSISVSFIEKLPSLKELHLGGWHGSNRRSVLPSSKATARIFYYDFEISLNQINQINLDERQFPASFLSSREETTEFIARNLHQSLDNNSNVTGIDYNAMSRALDDTEMFIVVPQKFPKISRLYISGAVADANRLLKFINHLSISYLEFERASLPQWFFEKLAASGSFIQTLWFRSEPTMDILSGDFEFLFKFANLRSFVLQTRPLALNFIIRLFKELKIRHVSFNHPGTYGFSMVLRDHMWKINSSVYGELAGGNDDEGVIEGDHDEDDEDEGNSLNFWHKFPAEDTPKLMGAFTSLQKADGVVCPRELLFRLQQLKLEGETSRFMMRKYIYDHTHSICLTLEQMMRLFNLIH